ncbi:glycosyltransferase family 4 protein [Vibrio owensii]|nr:glycosyltransferase family 4 protein [Vibrio owensii]
MKPTKLKPTSGLFVINQMEELKNNYGIEFFTLLKSRVFGGKISKFISYISFLFHCAYKLLTGLDHKIDLIHVHFYYPTIFYAVIFKKLFRIKSKLICTFHGSDVYAFHDSIGYKFLLKYIDHYIFVSDGLREKVIPDSELYNFSIIPAGIYNGYRYKSCDKKFDFCYVGSHYKIKGFDRLCRLLGETENFSVCICGTGDLTRMLTPEIIERHNIYLLGNVNQEQLIEIYNQSKYLISTSREESFGLVLAESMACGTPVISTDTDGAREQINHNVNGFILPNKDIESELILNYINIFNDKERYRELSNNSISNSRKYKLDNVAKEIMNVYERNKA